MRVDFEVASVKIRRAIYNNNIYNNNNNTNDSNIIYIYTHI